MNSQSPTNGSLSAVKNTMTKALASNSGIVALVIVVIIIIILIIIYIYQVFSESGLKQIELLDKIISLEQRENLPYSISASKMQVTTRGQEFAFSYWLYLSEYYENTTNDKLLFSRGNTSTNPTIIDSNANPVVVLDSSVNTMYIYLSTNYSNEPVMINDMKNPAKNYLIGKVDYVPLQRWVHFVIVIKDGNLMIFMDGELFAIKTVSDIPVAKGQRAFIKGTTGDCQIGSPHTVSKGFVGKFQFYNYSLSARQIQDIYKAGPVNKSMLAYIGLGNYGIRAPIYSMDQK
jgi:hypothetical protein